jgi:hypothetical protein
MGFGGLADLSSPVEFLNVSVCSRRIVAVLTLELFEFEIGSAFAFSSL